MKKRFNKNLLLITGLIISVFLTGCSIPGLSGEDGGDDPLLSVFDNTTKDDESEEDDESAEETESQSQEVTLNDGSPIEEKNLTEFTTEGLKDSTFYVRHSNNQCEELYMGQASFEGVSQTPSSSRVIWFMDDFKNIPTLYKGDSLIYYSTLEFDETFTLERFEDYGYTIGIKNAKITETGRVSLELGDEANTYPGADTDSLLALTNSHVIFEAIANSRQIREEPGSDCEKDQCIWLTRSGTFKTFRANELYEFVIYDGTIRNNIKLRANVRAMGSMETQKTLNYEYEVKDVIHINIPENYHSGYYMINGLGIFRYVDSEYSQDIDFDEIEYFNIPNVTEDEENMASISYQSIGSENTLDSEKLKGKQYESEIVSAYNSTNNNGLIEKDTGEISSKIVISKPGRVKILVTFTDPGTGDGLPDVKGKIVTPNGTKYLMAINASGDLVLDFEAETKGEYIIEYENLDVRVPHVQVFQEAN